MSEHKQLSQSASDPRSFSHTGDEGGARSHDNAAPHTQKGKNSLWTHASAVVDRQQKKQSVCTMMHIVESSLSIHTRTQTASLYTWDECAARWKTK